MSRKPKLISAQFLEPSVIEIKACGLSSSEYQPQYAIATRFEYYGRACKKGDPEANAVTVDQSPVAALANISGITGLPRENFEIHEILGRTCAQNGNDGTLVDKYACHLHLTSFRPGTS